MPGVRVRSRRRIRRRGGADRAGRRTRPWPPSRPSGRRPPNLPATDLFQLPQGAPCGGRGGLAAAGSAGGGESRGSVADGLAAADHKLEATYTIAYIAHRPAGAAGRGCRMGRRQADRLDRDAAARSACESELARALGVPEDRVRVIVPDTGSGYGGKHTGEAAVEAARLARAAGKPVKVVWTREEEFTWAYFRPAGVIDIKAGRQERRHADGLGVPQLQLGRLGPANPLRRSPIGAPGVPRRRLAPAPGFLPRPWRRRPTTLPANRTWTTWPRRCSSTRWSSACKNLKDDRLRAVLEAAAKQFGWGKAQPAAGHGFGLAAAPKKEATSPPAPRSPVDRHAAGSRWCAWSRPSSAAPSSIPIT